MGLLAAEARGDWPFEPPPVAAPPQPAASEGQGTGAAARHQLWVASTRGLPADDGGEPQWWRHQKDGWVQAGFEQFAGDNHQTGITVILVHGNETSHAKAIAKGVQVFEALRSTAGENSAFRLVVWSWPSERIVGTFRRDARVKARRTDREAHHIARTLARMGPHTPTSLVGYSFGARAITGALHLYGGGRIRGRGLAHQPAPGQAPMRALLLAAAIDNDWLLPGGEHALALGQVDQMLVTVNRQDRVLRWYPFMSRGVEALGWSGVADRGRLQTLAGRLVEFDAGAAVGRAHGWATYIESPAVVERIGQVALFDDLPPGLAAGEMDRTAGQLGPWRMAGEHQFGN